MNRLYIKCIIILLAFTCLKAQESGKITARKNELNELKEGISKLESEIRQKSSKEKKSLEIIENYNRQSLMLNKVINSLRKEESAAEERLNDTQGRIKKTEEKVRKLKGTYAKYIVYLYKHGQDFELSALFNSGSFNQALLRYKYLQRITSQREKDLAELKQHQAELSSLRNEYAKQRDEKRSLGSQKASEEQQLTKKLAERKSILASLRNDKQALRRELELKKLAEIQIRNLISKLIEEDRRRQAERKKAEEQRIAMEKKRNESIRNASGNKKNSRENEKAASAETPQSDIEFNNRSYDPAERLASFSALKGRLNWPVSRGRIIRRFGENVNSKLNTVTLNYGIDIKASGPETVTAVAEGIVSSISWVPGYGSVLILTHKNGYRTVYGHLSEIHASEGSTVSAGSSIGTVGESLEGNILHFEIWNERTNQNPESWLSRK